MGRWTQYDEDEYRLPEGMRRTGYDADTGTYYFVDDDADMVYQSAPYVRYGVMNPIGRVGDVNPEIYGSISQAPAQSSSNEEFHPMDTIIEAATRVADRVIPPIQRFARNARDGVMGLPEGTKYLGRSATLPSRRPQKSTGYEEKLSSNSESKHLSRSATLQPTRQRGPSNYTAKGENKPFPSQWPLFAPSGKLLSRSVSLPVRNSEGSDKGLRDSRPSKEDSVRKTLSTSSQRIHSFPAFAEKRDTKTQPKLPIAVKAQTQENGSPRRSATLPGRSPPRPTSSNQNHGSLSATERRDRETHSLSLGDLGPRRSTTLPSGSTRKTQSSNRQHTNVPSVERDTKTHVHIKDSEPGRQPKPPTTAKIQRAATSERPSLKSDSSKLAPTSFSKR